MATRLPPTGGLFILRAYDRSRVCRHSQFHGISTNRAFSSKNLDRLTRDIARYFSQRFLDLKFLNDLRT